ncbi:N-acetylmuramoyl-L-alanine amidase [Saliterribacillus persicus]|uniref:N-acetylmuramoyl-L-alanine amidase n=1 Tax=Saliterribacillus persicus TaxID=930114 RepID=A0A368XK80_9BACI|nr:N-acetylmuramoyl-L-alanine amidase [Saliterribacillus persicus]RCW66444.1 N-acetylmuramoyl-L-alanine amidase [Saliterribacillus persicus]
MQKRLAVPVILCSLFIILSLTSMVYAENAKIDTNNLNVRSGPGLDFEVITQVNQPESYPIVEESGDWVKIQLNNEEGWITKDYITISESEIQEEEIEEEMSKEINSSPPSKSSSKVNKNKDFSDLLIVIDPGHGGRDVGAIGDSDAFEKDYTMRTAQLLKEKLEKLGANVKLTRTQDNYVPLTSRASFSNIQIADIFLSLHYNSTPEYPNAKGISTYYYSDRDEELANSIQYQMLSQTGMEDRRVHQEDLQVLRTNHRPSLLLELGFISNKEEEHNIQSKAFQDTLTRAIIMGISQHFQK